MYRFKYKFNFIFQMTETKCFKDFLHLRVYYTLLILNDWEKIVALSAIMLGTGN